MLVIEGARNAGGRLPAVRQNGETRSRPSWRMEPRGLEPPDSARGMTLYLLRVSQAPMSNDRGWGMSVFVQGVVLRRRRGHRNSRPCRGL